MHNLHPDDDDMPAEIDFSRGVRGLHHIPADSKVYLPAAIERSVWQYFSAKAKQKGVGMAELLTEVLARDIEINAAPKIIGPAFLERMMRCQLLALHS